MSGPITGIILLNLGGPETLDQVRPFLYNLFSDPDIVRLPIRALQKPLAWLISMARYKKSRGYYAKIGGGSPIRRITQEQAEALARALEGRGLSVKTYVGMRYWHPFIEEAFEQICRDGITHLVALPLYPQYSISTTGSSLNKLNQLLRRDHNLRFSAIKSWHADHRYISALASSIAEELTRFPDQGRSSTHIVFTAHSVPVRYITREGDPYLDQTQQTVRLVMERLGLDRPHVLSFQSKVGPVRWLEPSTDATIRRLAREGASQLLLVPVSFVSEHIETLYELDILYASVAREVGIAHCRRVPALNCRPDFIEALAGIVQDALAN
jgi:ferrochelatase